MKKKTGGAPEATEEQPMVVRELSGTWSHQPLEGGIQYLIFNADNRVRWLFQYPGLTEEMKLLYRFDPTADPPQFDLSGFLSEAMQGRTLYGIIEFESEDKFRWEANPGAAGSNGAGIRPNRFDGLRTKIYRRVN